jgi:hypothetical protein
LSGSTAETQLVVRPTIRNNVNERRPARSLVHLVVEEPHQRE